jgi:hypothetical protein
VRKDEKVHKYQWLEPIEKQYLPRGGKIGLTWAERYGEYSPARLANAQMGSAAPEETL